MIFFFLLQPFHLFPVFKKVAPVGTNSDQVGRGRRLDRLLRVISLGDFSLVLIKKLGQLCHVISFFFLETNIRTKADDFLCFLLQPFQLFPFLRRCHHWQLVLPKKTPRLIKSIFFGKDSGSRTAAHKVSRNGENAAYL